MKNIEWADITINPVVGCKRGCPYCYARKMNDRFHFVKDFTNPELFIERLEKLNHVKNKKIFMNSMSDIQYWDAETIRTVAKYIEKNPSNKYYFLSKDPLAFINMMQTASRGYPPLGYIYNRDNVFGVITITRQDEFYDYVTMVYKNRVLNIEPILERIDLSCIKEPVYTLDNYGQRTCKTTVESFEFSHNIWLKHIDLIILGAETGNRKDKVIPKKEWIEEIIDFCKKYNIELFLKENIKKYLKGGRK